MGRTKQRKAVWESLTALILVILLVNGLANLVGRPQVAASDSRIGIEEADSIVTFDLVFSSELASIASTAKPRVVVQYANSIEHESLTPLPSQLVTEVSEVSSRMIIEYANSIYTRNLENPPSGLADAASNVVPRVLVEYANSICHHRLQEPFATNNAPTCVIELREQGTTTQIDKVDVGQFFDIYVGDSTDDTGIRQVRFSSDEERDGNPTGEWTGWYDWDISLGDWNAETRTMAWAFHTGILKEVWAEVKDSIGWTSAEAANIKAAYAPDSCGYRFMNRGVRKDVSETPINEGLSENSKERIFNEVFAQSGIKDDYIKSELMDRFGLGPKDNSFSGGSCYGMAVSSLMEYAYPHHDPFCLNPQQEIPVFELNEDGQDPQEVIQDGYPRWDASDANGGIDSNPLLERILKFQVSQFGLAYQDNYMDFSLNATALAPFLEAEINNSRMYAVVIGYYEPKGWWIFKSYDYLGHALTPYRVDEAENKIYVYDCNQPADPNCFIDVSDAGWKYDLGWTTWPPSNAVDPHIRIVPIEKLYNYGLQTVVPIGGGTVGSVFSLEGGSNLLLTDTESRVTGFSDGVFLEEIPGVRRIDAINVMPDAEDGRSSQQTYYIDNDEQLAATIQGTGTEPYSLTKFGPAYFAEVSSRFDEDGQVHTAALSSDEAQVSFLQGQEPEDTLLPQDQEQAVYSVTLHKNIDGTGQTLSAIDVHATSGAMHQYTVDWDALSQCEPGVTIQKDTDGDGDFEETIVTSQPNTPSGPSPSNHAANVSTETDLGWSGGDPDAGDTVTYHVYFGSNSTPPFKETIGPYASNETSMSYDPETLGYNTTYYWKIVARDNHGITREGPVWDFTTEKATVYLVEGANIVCYPGVNSTLADAFTNIGPAGLDVVEIIWARSAWTDGQWWLYNVAQDYAWPSAFTHLENGRAYLIVVREDCSWELPSCTNIGSAPSSLDLVEGANIVCYLGATATLAESLTNIGLGGSEVAEIIWARAACTNGDWWFYNVAQDYSWPSAFTHLENGRAYIIVVSQGCTWEFA